jgi:hypothetical protein
MILKLARRPARSDLLEVPSTVTVALRSIWNLYKDAAPLDSKSYATSGTSSAVLRGVIARLNNVDDGFPVGRATSCPEYFAPHQEHTEMMDVIMLAIGLGFFALSVGYCHACDRL